MKHNRIKVPHSYGFSKNSLPVYSNKPPKLRFRPGQYVELDKEIFEIIYVYRKKMNLLSGCTV